MMLQRELAIRGLDLHLGRRALHTENFVIIAFAVDCQGILRCVLVVQYFHAAFVPTDAAPTDANR
jgi:hypothetical protein